MSRIVEGEMVIVLNHGKSWPVGTVAGDILYRHSSAPANVLYAVYSADGKVLRGFISPENIPAGSVLDYGSVIQ